MSLTPDPRPGEVTIFTDGACNPNPGPGGWAAVIRTDGREKVLTGHEAITTNNRMELTAALRALQAVKKSTGILLVTDSEYLRRGVTEWLPGWQSKGWKRKGGALANIDLWQALALELGRHTIRWKWVRGHAGHGGNLLVDRLARQAIMR